MRLTREIRAILARPLARAAGASLLALCLLPLVGSAQTAERPTFVRALGSQGRLGALNGPAGVAYASAEAGDFLYVVDSGNARIQVFSDSGQVVGAFGARGPAPEGFWAPSDIAVAPGGDHVYVVDRRHRIVQQFAPSAPCLEGRARCFVRAWGGWGTGPGQFQDPTGIAVDRFGRVYVADWSGHVVQVFDPEGVPIRTIGRVGSGRGELMHPSDVDVADDGTIWVADRDNDRLSVFDQEGNYVTGHTFGDRLHYPVGIAFGVGGTFSVADYDPGYGQPRLRMFTAERKLLREVVLGGDGRPSDYPLMGVAMLPGNRAIASAPAGPHSALAEVPVEGDVVWMGERGRALDQFVFPWSVAIDPLFLAVVDAGNRRVLVLEPEGSDRVLGVLGGELAPQFDFADPRGIAVWRSGPQSEDAVILVADPVRNLVYRATPGGRRLDAWGTGQATDAPEGFRHPVDVAVGPGGVTYIADTGNDRIVRRGPDGAVLGTIGPFDSDQIELRKPIAVAVGPGGHVYVLEQSRSRLQAFTSEGDPVGLWPGTDLRDVAEGRLWMPVDLASDGDRLYVLENESIQQGSGEHVRIQVFEPVPGTPLESSLVSVFAEHQGAAEGQLWNPRGVAAMDGWVAVTDSGNNRVQLFRWLDNGIAPPPLLPTETPEPSATPTEPPTPTPTPTLTPTDEPRPTDPPSPTPTAPPPTATATGIPPSPTATGAEPTQARSDPTDVPTVEPTRTATVVAPTPTLATPNAEKRPRPVGRVNYLPLTVR